MTPSRLTTILVAGLALGLALYQRVEIGRLRTRLVPAAPASEEAASGGAACELRLRALAARGAPAAPAGEVRARRHDAAPVAPAADAPDSPFTSADPIALHELGKRLIESSRATSLDLPENRKTWIRQFAIEQGLSSDQATSLGAVFETEFEHRAGVIAEAKAGTRTRKNARTELARLAVSANERARGFLGAALYEKYVARRTAAGLPVEGGEPHFLTMSN